MLLACKSGGYNNQLIEKINWKIKQRKKMIIIDIYLSNKLKLLLKIDVLSNKTNMLHSIIKRHE
jgi:hypothetical protein